MEQANGSVAMKQRIHRSEEEILKLLDEQEKSGFTVKEFCELSDINEATFYSWIKKYRKSEEEEKGFTTIEIVPSVKELKPQLFAEVGNVKLYKEVSAEFLKALS
jgi:hypothetical protein